MILCLQEGGRRVDWDAAGRSIKLPVISVITSTYNAAQNLQWTIDSIRAQTYPSVQWIVADGGSTDGTVDLIKKNEDIVDYWFSEPDSGIYDAWNKALKHAKGEWIQFIGAGDELAESTTLDKMAAYLAGAYPDFSLVYGRLQYLSEATRVIVDEVGEPWESLTGRWEFFRPKLPVHPAIFHHRSLLSMPEPFDRSYKVAADNKLLMQHIKENGMLYVPILIDKMPLGGVSGTIAAAYRVAMENRRAAKECGFKPPLSHVFFEYFKLITKRALVFLLPMGIVHRVADTYRVMFGHKKRWTL